MTAIRTSRTEEIRHGHLFCGLGGGAKGFNRGRATLDNVSAGFRCIGGIDVDPAAIADFQRLSGARGTVLDLFTREDFTEFHGKQPPEGWRVATADDIRAAFGGEAPNILFTSAPCKGFSGLLSNEKSESAKYQALNRLTLHGLWLALEAFADDPPEFVLFENVPRIQTRGRHLLDQIVALLQAYGYATAETTHDCGELGGLGQSRKRFLLVARHREKVPPFLYEPPRRPLRSVGEVLGDFPLPGDPKAGPMHRMRQLQMKTWIRLAFVEAGKDWRSLERLRVVDGKLADYLLEPVAAYHRGYLGVTDWNSASGTVCGESRPSNGNFSVADPRHAGAGTDRPNFGVTPWGEPSGTITGQRSPGQGRFSVADPRIDAHPKSVQFGVRKWDESAGVVTGRMEVGGGPNSVADPRYSKGEAGPHYNNVFRVVRWDQNAGAVTAGGGPTSGGQAVADPRTGWQDAHRNKLNVRRWDGTAGCVTGAVQPASGGLCIADPRWHAGHAENHLRNGLFGVVPWTSPSGAVTASAGHDSGAFTVADPRRFPAPEERVLALIVAEDGTWHRPFTTLELAALQSLVTAEEFFELEGTSDSAHRERIGNAVPAMAAAAIASVMGHAILLARAGETFVLSASPIWVRPVAIAISVDTPQ